MYVKGNRKKILSLILISGSVCLFLTGCSSLKKTYSFLKFWDTKETRQGLSDAEWARFASSIRPHPGNPDAHYLLACYNQDRGRHKEALEEFKKVILIDPMCAKAYNGMGISYDQLRDFSQAGQCYEAALKLGSDLDYVYNNRGYSYLLQGRHDLAIEAFKKAITLNGQNRRVHNNLGMTYAMRGQYELALDQFAWTGDKSWGHYLLARFFYEKGRHQEAYRHYAQALALDPTFTEAQKGLEAAEVLSIIAQAGSKQEAKASPASRPEKDVKTVAEPAPQEAIVTKAPLKSVPEVCIEISNGNGVNRMARNVGCYLREKGFNVVRLTNADHFNQPQGRIYYQEDGLEAARQIAKQIPIRDLEKVSSLGRPHIKVKVLIGKDMVPHRKLFAANRS